MRCWLILLATVLMAVVPVRAHEGRPIHIDIAELASGQFQVRWKIPPVLRASEIPSVRLEGATCQQTTGRAASLVGAEIYQCGNGVRPANVALSFPGYNPALSTLVMFTTLDGDNRTLLVGPEEKAIPLPEQQTFASVAAQYTSEGFNHILDGFDHLLFVFCLILLVGGFGRILLAVTGFTVGHSITLGITALYDLSLSPAFVEPLIALSIVMLAAEKLSAARFAGQTGETDASTLAVRYPAIIASLFGLLHGFGFGGALAEIGLPYGYKLTALAFFNIGVELGQVAFILFVLLLAKGLQAFVRLGSWTFATKQAGRWLVYPAGIMAGFWTVERVSSIWI